MNRTAGGRGLEILFFQALFSPFYRLTSEGYEIPILSETQHPVLC